jgi:uncharacterized membrane protein YfcA
MSLLEIIILAATGVLAGIINTVVGSGSLVTFPTLLALGYPPVLANVTNNVGVLPGSVSGAVAYRKELRGQWRSIAKLAALSAVGGGLGALLLLVLPAAAFRMIVPVLIIFACVLVVVGPPLKRWLLARSASKNGSKDPLGRIGTAVGLTGIYGGYFGAAQGVILLSSLMVLMRGSTQRANGYKNVFAATANGAAAVIFVLATPVAWLAALVIAVGAVVGGQIGGRIGHRLPEYVYRIIIILIGIIAVIYFYTT